MKTTFKLLPVFLAGSVPVAMAAELSGVSLPAGTDALSLFCAFVACLVTMMAAGDYARHHRSSVARVAAPVEKAAHPLAA